MEGLRHGGVSGYVLVSVLTPCPHSCGVLICVSWFYNSLFGSMCFSHVAQCSPCHLVVYGNLFLPVFT